MAVFLSHWLLSFCRLYSDYYTTNNRSTMIYQPENEKAAMAGGVYMSVPRPLTMADESQIKRTRKILVIILGVCLVSSRQAGPLLMCSDHLNLSPLGSVRGWCDFCHIWIPIRFWATLSWTWDKNRRIAYLHSFLQFWIIRRSSLSCHGPTRGMYHPRTFSHKSRSSLSTCSLRGWVWSVSWSVELWVSFCSLAWLQC